MNNIIAFFVGCITFVIVMIIKIPYKKWTYSFAQRTCQSEERMMVRNRHLNGFIFIIVFAIAVICYYFVLQFLGNDHFKLCCSLKAGAIAIAFYAIFEQWFGGEIKRGEHF